MPKIQTCRLSLHRNAKFRFCMGKGEEGRGGGGRGERALLEVLQPILYSQNYEARTLNHKS